MLFQKNMSKYTFLLPAYKGRFLDEMLNSIKNQTYPDFKVLISDDCSPENLKDICEPYLQDERFSYRRNEKNIGGENLVEHWNMLVNMCDTDYLIMATDDDVYDPDFLFHINELVEAYPDVYVYRARVRRIDEEDTLLMKDMAYDEYQNQLEFLYHLYSFQYQRGIGNFVFKTDTLIQEGGFVSFPYAWYSDLATEMLLAKQGIAHTKEILFNFRNSEINISNMKNSRNMSRGKMNAAIKYGEWFEQMIISQLDTRSKYNKQLTQFVVLRYKKDLLWQFYHLINDFNFIECLKIVKRFKELNILTSSKERLLVLFHKIRYGLF